MPVRNVVPVRVHPGVHLKFCIRGVHSGSCTGTKRSYRYEIWPYSVPVSRKGDTRFRSGTIWVTELIGTGSEGLSIGNTSLKWLTETKSHMKRRVIPVKWLPCKHGTKLDFVPVSCKQPLTCLNFTFSGTCDRIVLYLKLRWYCRDGSLTRPLKKIGPGVKLENYQLSAVTDRDLQASYMYVRQNFNKIIFKSNYTDLAELQSRTQSLLKLLTAHAWRK